MLSPYVSFHNLDENLLILTYCQCVLVCGKENCGFKKIKQNILIFYVIDISVLSPFPSHKQFYME